VKQDRQTQKRQYGPGTSIETMKATNPATYKTSYLLTSKTGSQSWWRPQIKGQNVDEQVCFL